MKVFSIGLAILNDRITKGVCVASHLVGLLQKRWIASVNDCFK